MHYTRFERARIVGARALQIAMGAPVLIEVPDVIVNPVDIAIREFGAGVIPITVKRSVPPKQEIGKTFVRPKGSK
jgi:DNA-directed RNA polymerase subunit K